MFVDLYKLTQEAKDHLSADECPNEKKLCVLLKPYKDITEAVKRLAGQKSVQILVSIASLGQHSGFFTLYMDTVLSNTLKVLREGWRETRA